MSLLDAELVDGRTWSRVGDSYEVTKKPRGVDRAAFSAIPFAAMEAIPQSGAYPPEFTIKAPNQIASGTYFERGDILVSKITPSFENGKQALIQHLDAPFGYATTEVIPLHRRSEEHDPRLLFFYLLHPDIRHYVAERMEGSTGRQRVPENVLLDLPIPAFDQGDQTAIADVLEIIQVASSAEAQCEKSAQDLKRAAMGALFTRGLRGEAQRETDIGLVPESWDVASIGDVSLNTQYGLSVRGQTSGPYAILRMNCQEDGAVHYRNLQFVDLDEPTYETFRLKQSDLLFNRTNSIELVGRMSIIHDDRPAVFASYLVRLTVDEKRCLPRFLNYFMNWPATQAEIKKLASRSVGQANINASKLRTVQFPLPPTLDEQREIVDILDAIDQKIVLHRRKRGVLDDLFKSLLHKLMTGEIRVGDLDLAVLNRSEVTGVAA